VPELWQREAVAGHDVRKRPVSVENRPCGCYNPSMRWSRLFFSLWLCSGVTACWDQTGAHPLASTGEPIIVDAYATIADCVRAGRLDERSCRNALDTSQALHPQFALRWSTAATCQQEHGVGTCSRLRCEAGPCWAARPSGFLLCYADDRQCAGITAAPVYRLTQVGDVTGVGGGTLEHVNSGNRYARRVGSRFIYPRPVS
jgi:hypothetical protein